MDPTEAQYDYINVLYDQKDTIDYQYLSTDGESQNYVMQLQL